MNETLRSILNFYRDVYQAEYNTEKIPNFFSNKVGNLYFPKTFELVSEPGYELPVDSAWGLEVANELEIGSSERKLVCGTFFIRGKIQVLGKFRKLFAPLYLQDVFFKEEGGVYSVRVDGDSLNLNPVAVDYLNSLDRGSGCHYDQLSDLLVTENNPFSFDGLVALVRELSAKYPLLNCTLLDQRIGTGEQLVDLKKAYASRKGGYNNQLLPESAIGMVEKPLKSKGVINELTELGTVEHGHSSLLRRVFGVRAAGKEKVDDSKQRGALNVIVPASLSKQQNRIIESVASSSLTLVIGPPGTGKSFSIAALAIQAAHEGKKVLVASKNERACQVINDKIIRDIGVKGLSLDASKPRYRISVSSKLRNVANGVGVKKLHSGRYEDLQREVAELKRAVFKEIAEISRRELEEIKWGRKLSRDKKGVLSALREFIIWYRHDSRTPLWKLKFDLHRKEASLRKKEKQLISQSHRNRLYRLLGQSRSELLTVEKVFQEERGNLKKEIFTAVNFQQVLNALPVWICKSPEIANILPLQEALFDLVIIDEASQCDIASSIPLLYRAKSAVIVGDPNQLRHVSFLSGRKEWVVKEKYGIHELDIRFRDRSILDQVNEVIERQENVIFLDEHFRSKPDIIDFSNQHFYAGQLKVMTVKPGTENQTNISVRIVDGERSSRGDNPVEARHVVRSIKKVVRLEQDLRKGAVTTIGVISPFRAQVETVKKMIREEIGLQGIKRHRIMVATPFGFQGEERELVYLTFAIDRHTHGSVFRYLDRPGMFNVSITRARSRQEVYLSLGVQELSQNSLLYQYLEHRYEPSQGVASDSVYDSFLDDVLKHLRKRRVGTILIDHVVSGARLDLVIVRGERIRGIDLVGFPGEFQEQLTVENIKTLERANVDVFLLPYSTWYFDRQLCVRELKKFLEKK